MGSIRWKSQSVVHSLMRAHSSTDVAHAHPWSIVRNGRRPGAWSIQQFTIVITRTCNTLGTSLPYMRTAGGRHGAFSSALRGRAAGAHCAITARAAGCSLALQQRDALSGATWLERASPGHPQSKGYTDPGTRRGRNAGTRHGTSCAQGDSVSRRQAAAPPVGATCRTRPQRAAVRSSGIRPGHQRRRWEICGPVRGRGGVVEVTRGRRGRWWRAVASAGNVSCWPLAHAGTC